MPAPAPPPRLTRRLADLQASAPEEIEPVSEAEPEDAAELEPADDVETPEGVDAPEDGEVPDDVEVPDHEVPADVAVAPALPGPAGAPADDPDDAAQPAVRTAAASSGKPSSVFFMGSPVTYLWCTNIP